MVVEPLEPPPAKRQRLLDNAGYGATATLDLVNRDENTTSISDISTLDHRRKGPVTFRPYSDIRPAAKRRWAPPGGEVTPGGGGVVTPTGGTTTVYNLYPEILCIVFSHLDVAAKGRAAQVRTSLYYY